jgi:hypothetical protein
VQPDIPGAVMYPVEEMLREFGPYFFTSSLSYMAALAITKGKADAIGFWGVDMSAQEEWEGQRGGCHYFIQKARERGVAVIAPHESDLLRPPPLYGHSECNPMYVKLRARDRELTQRYHIAVSALQQKQREVDHLAGALDDNKYQMKTWISDPFAIEMAYSNPQNYRLPEVAEKAQAEQAAQVEPVVDKVAEAAHEIDQISTAAGVTLMNGKSTDMTWPPEYPVERSPSI